MVLWIPGVKGFVGSAFAKAARGHSIGTMRETVDISNLAAVRDFARKNPGITHIVNCAAFSGVDQSETETEKAHLANAVGPENLGLVAREIGARLVHLSTDYVFQGDLHRPLTELDLVNPPNTYGKTKLEGEIRLKKVFPEACIIRVSWVFGQGGKNILCKLFELLQTRKELQLNCDQWSRSTYVPDLVKVILQLLDRSGTYHFANSGATTKYEFGLAMKEEAEQLQIPIVTESILPTPGSAFHSPCKRPSYSAFDTTKIEQELQYKPRSWRETLKEYLEEHAPIALTP